VRLHARIEAKQHMHNAMVDGPMYDADKPPPQSGAGIGAHIGAVRQSTSESQQNKEKSATAGGPGEICYLHCLLQPTTNAYVRRQRFAGASTDPTGRPGCRLADLRRTSSSILPDIVFSRLRLSVGMSFYPRTGATRTCLARREQWNCVANSARGCRPGGRPNRLAFIPFLGLHPGNVG
jgi:hypothetical protein